MKRPAAWANWECPDPSNPIDPTGTAIASTDPATLPASADLDPSPRHSVVRNTRDTTEVQQWSDRDVLFEVTDVDYWDPVVEDFTLDCAAADYRWPAARVSFSTCIASAQAGTLPAGACNDGQVLEGQAVQRRPVRGG